MKYILIGLLALSVAVISNSVNAQTNCYRVLNPNTGVWENECPDLQKNNIPSAPVPAKASIKAEKISEVESYPVYKVYDPASQASCYVMFQTSSREEVIPGKKGVTTIKSSSPSISCVK